PVKRARPGQVYLIDSESGGYSDQLGWTGHAKDKAALNFVPAKEEPESMAGDRESFVGKFILVNRDTRGVGRELEKLMAELELDGARAALRTAALWHDVGKAPEYFQRWMTDGARDRAGE